MIDSPLPRRVGEVMVSHTERVAAQCYRLHAAPPLGALVRIGSPPVYGVVREIWHEPLDPGRPLAPRGAGLESEDDIYAANPQLPTMLTTRFAATVIGYGNGPEMRPGLPPQPPNLHAFVFLGDAGEIAAFAAELRWLGLLLADRSPAADAALAGFLRCAAGTMTDRRAFLLHAGRRLAAELAAEPQRLQSLLRELAV